MGLTLQDTAGFNQLIHDNCCIAIGFVAHHVSSKFNSYMVRSIYFHYRPKLIIHWAWHFLTLLDLIFIYIIMQLLHGYDVLYTPYRKNLIATLSDPYIFTVDQSYLIHHGLCISGHCSYNIIDPVYMHAHCCMAIGFVAHVVKHVAVHLVRSVHFHYRPKLIIHWADTSRYC